MAMIVRMPKLGVNMEEGQITKWMVEVGGEVKKGEPLFEVATDKTTIEIEATINGFLLKTMVELDTDYDCGTPICIIGEKDEDISTL